ncbi:MAG: aminopeptidase [Clostridium sp.]|nr:aminopeptidase [Clostridium sp.]MCM1547021.1 aminopeptidase [Ruminococcus sp.]
MSKEKSEGKKFKESLLSKKENAFLKMDESEIKKCDSFCEGYKAFLDNAKTEREAVEYTIKLIEEKGFTEYKPGMKLKAGDKIYRNNRGKAVIMAVIGEKNIAEGVRLCAAHIDSPRLDLKQNPLYEDTEMALFKTHYYGGIKKYQWTVIPLALHGVIVKADGSKVKVNIGESDGDPVFCVNDLLPHLAADQMKRTLAQGVKGEELNIVIGSRPFRENDLSDAVKLNIMKILNEKYGIIEDDFLSAELEAVPAFKAKDIGFDRSMIGSYGHDDRVCAYTALMATIDCEDPEYTAVTVLTDKEETGSDGNTGLQSAYLKYFIADLAKEFGTEGRTVLSNSQCMSADVNAAFDPTFPDVMEKRNCAFINYGVCVTKFTGARGKSGTSDASAEFVGKIRKLLNDNGVIWQTGELGKVDQGGGGTVAAYIANLNVDVIDVGVPVLSMHAPFETVSKIDVYQTYRAFSAFIK